MDKRRKQRANLKAKKQKKEKRLLFVKILVFLMIVAGILFFFKAKYWSGEGRLFLVVNGEEEIMILNFDPEGESLLVVKLPLETQMILAGELGTWKLGSVWKLGFNEGQEGELLARSLAKNLNLPLFLWADSSAQGFASRNMGELLKASLFPYQTNLSLGDRLRLGLFSLTVKPLKRTVVNLSETEVLSLARLSDGSNGYLMKDKLPPKILSLFASSQITQDGLRAKIIDSTQKYGLAEQVGELLEVVGFKVVAIEKERVEENCLVRAKDKMIGQRISQVFGCYKEELLGAEENVDLELYLGKAFSKTF